MLVEALASSPVPERHPQVRRALARTLPAALGTTQLKKPGRSAPTARAPHKGPAWPPAAHGSVCPPLSSRWAARARGLKLADASGGAPGRRERVVLPGPPTCALIRRGRKDGKWRAGGRANEKAVRRERLNHKSAHMQQASATSAGSSDPGLKRSLAGSARLALAQASATCSG